METKICLKCKIPKPLSDFQFDKRKIHQKNKGYCSPCKQCKYSQKSNVRKERRILLEIQAYSFSKIPTKKKSTIFKRQKIVKDYLDLETMNDFTNFVETLYAEKRNIKFKTFAHQKENSLMLYCLQCFESLKLKTPIPVNDLTRAGICFNKIHLKCCKKE
jgi:hypothetical protein